MSAPPSIKAWCSKAFNWPVLAKSRWHWVDYLRGIAILLVVYRHALLGIQYGNIHVSPILERANMIFFSFRMPLFFILSGIFIGGSMARKSLSQLIGSKFENLLYPYIIWSIIQITLQILLAGSTNSNRTWIDYSYILYQPRDLDQFWYLPALFNCSVIYLLVKDQLKPPAWTQLALGLGLYLLAPYLQSVSMLSDWMRFYVFFALGDGVATFFFKESSQRFLKNPWSLVGIAPFFVLAQLFYLSQDESVYLNSIAGQLEFLAIALIGCLSMIILSFRLQSWNALPFLRVLGFHSLYIYVMHVMIAAGSRVILIRLFGIHNPYILLASGIFFGVTLPVIFYNLLVENNILWFLFSYRKKKPKAAPAPASREALAS
jgi:fucose 4-O-acetylase-like acetyltransferase